LGSLQKGSIDIVGCTVVAQNWTVRGRDFVFRIVSPTQTTPIEIAAQSEEEMVEWVSKIRETSQLVNDKVCHLIQVSIEYMIHYLHYRSNKTKKWRKIYE